MNANKKRGLRARMFGSSHAALSAAVALLALPLLSQAQSTTTVVRTVQVEYDAYGQVLRETVEPNDAALKLVTEYARLPVGGVDYGLVSSKTVKWTDPVSATLQTRVVQSLTYDAQGRFPLTTTNALNQPETRSYSDANGNVLTLLDVNNLTTSWQYDSWGRKTRETRPDNTATTWAYRQCVDSCSITTTTAVNVVITQNWSGTSQTTVPSETFNDARGREVMTRSWGFDGSAIVAEKLYNAQGYVASIGRPRFQATSTAVWTHYLRDALGRVDQIQHPNSTGSGYHLSQYTYAGLTLTHTNAKNQQRIEQRNGLGKPKTVTDDLGNVTSYLYDPFGNLARTTDPKGNQIHIGYDRLGRKTSLNDPDLGAWQYWVDPLGQTWRQQDAKAQITTFEFDPLGRMTRRLEPDQDSRWDYDSATKGKGQLAETYTWVAGAKDYRRVHTYDSLGRPDTTTISLDWDYVAKTLYDGFGRAYQTDHTRRARGATSGGATTSVRTDFNALGEADKVYRVVGGASTLLWEALAEDAEGRITRSRQAGALVTQRDHNAYTGRLGAILTGPAAGASVNPTHQNDIYQYDVLGNLSYRAQLMATGSGQLQETFGYDRLNRLDFSTLNGSTRNHGYDETGNLTAKTHVGSYHYPPSGAGSIRPHAVSAITGSVAGLTNPSFSYDANGNLVNGLNRSYAWRASNQPSMIDKLSAGVAIQRTEFVYGPDHERAKQVIRPVSGGSPGAPTTTLYYAGAIQKEIDVAANVTIIRTSVAGVGYIEERIAGTAANPTDSAARNGRFFLKDHLGSTIGITDETGAVLQRMSYDAWGRRRNTDGTDDSWASLGTIANNQDNTGYTGHQQLDQLGLVDMNARFYDPITGRHTSADPTVPDPGNAQAFNRYSYVLNNALVFTDPTGLGPNPVFVTLSNPHYAFSEQKNEADDRRSYGTFLRPKDEPPMRLVCDIYGYCWMVPVYSWVVRDSSGSASEAKGAAPADTGDMGSPESDRQGLSDTQGDRIGMDIIRQLPGVNAVGCIAGTCSKGEMALAAVGVVVANPVLTSAKGVLPAAAAKIDAVKIREIERIVRSGGTHFPLDTGAQLRAVAESFASKVRNATSPEAAAHVRDVGLGAIDRLDRFKALTPEAIQQLRNIVNGTFKP